MKLSKFTTLFIFSILFSLGLVSHARADYYAQGTLQSENLLSVSEVTAITGFSVTATVPAGTSVSVSFSQNKVDFYSSDGTEGGWEACAGGETNINLSGAGLLNWSGGIFFYKIKLETTDPAATPVVSEAELTYDGGAPVAGNPRYYQGIMASENLLSGATVTAINSFSVTSDIPLGTTAGVKFSQDNVHYFNSAGAAEEWDALSDGVTNVDLSGLSWSGGSLFYKIKLESTVDSAYTPAVTDVSLDYDGTPPVAGNPHYAEGILMSTDILSGTGMVMHTTNRFGYNVSSLPYGTHAYIQFSTDGATWYDSAGAQWEWDELDAGNHLNPGSAIELSTLDWEGETSFYYKLKFTTTVDNAVTPVVSEIALLEKSSTVASSDLPPPGNSMTINMSLTDKLTDGLVGMWSFDGPDVNIATNTAYDRSPVGTNHGTISGATPTIGKKGQGLGFDGNDFTTITDPGVGSVLDFSNGSNITLSGWIRAPLDVAGIGVVAEKGVNYGLEVGAGGAGASRRIEFYYYSGGWQIYSTTSAVLAPNTWTHFVATFNFGTASSAKIYINGSLVSGSWTGGDGTPVVNADNNALLFGKYRGNSEYFKGTLDEFRIYNRALAEEEVGDLYNLGGVKITN